MCVCKKLEGNQKKNRVNVSNSKNFFTWEHKIIIIMCSHCVKLIGKEEKFRIKFFFYENEENNII
jgi:hypothetical protein